MAGTAGRDIFVISDLALEEPVIIEGFNAEDGDIIDISNITYTDLDEDPNKADYVELLDYILVTMENDDTLITIDETGSGNFDGLNAGIILTDVDLGGIHQKNIPNYMPYIDAII